MSTENISISIDPSPLASFITAIVREQLQPTLYDNDNPVAQVVNEEIANNPKVRASITTMITNVVDSASLVDKINDCIVGFFENSYRADRLISRSIDHGELAGNIDMADLAGEISYRELASEIDTDDVAHRIEIDMDSLAENIDYKKLAAALLEEMAVRVKN